MAVVLHGHQALIILQGAMRRLHAFGLLVVILCHLGCRIRNALKAGKACIDQRAAHFAQTCLANGLVPELRVVVRQLVDLLASDLQAMRQVPLRWPAAAAADAILKKPWPASGR